MQEDRDAVSTQAKPKPLRADAARNRQKLLDTATRAFADEGADVPLEDVARAAGVGIGTLYRHFPAREDLVLAVYSQQVEGLVQRSHDLLRQLPPGEALHEWMRGFVDYSAVKMGMVHLLRSMVEGPRAEAFTTVRAQLLEAADRVLAPAVDAGAVRPDVTPQELSRALSGICLATASSDGQQTSLAIVDLVFDGLRYGAGSSGAS